MEDLDQDELHESPPQRKLNPEFERRIWKPGQSGNPAGRPKSLARRVRELVGEDGLELVMGFARVWAGEERGFGGRERLEAGKWLSDRGFGPAKNADQLAQELEDEGKRPAQMITSKDLETMARQLLELSAKTPGTKDEDP